MHRRPRASKCAFFFFFFLGCCCWITQPGLEVVEWFEQHLTPLLWIYSIVEDLIDANLDFSYISKANIVLFLLHCNFLTTSVTNYFFRLLCCISTGHPSLWSSSHEFDEGCATVKFLGFTPSFVCSTMIQTLCDDNAGCAVFIMTCSYSLGSRGSTGGVVTMAHNWLFVVDTRTMPTAKSHTSGTPSCCPGRPEGESAPKLVDPQCKDGRSSWTCADSIILWTRN